ncbi:MAG TPA: hypothetical protein VM076_21190 [Gemmatimonadaceae bacterium]|nr:hypothetical protein [Gemmatimonadaceae bacterium]
MKRFVLIATILVVAAGCDKTKSLLGIGRREFDGPPPGARLDLTKRPDVVFQLFGERDDARMMPVAAIIDGTLKPIELTASGWREFDAMYTRSDKSYGLYRDGSRIGEAKVRRGMWERSDEPLYSLPGCRLVTPLAAVSLETDVRLSFTIEALAVTAGVNVQPKAPVKQLKGLEARAQRIAYEVARNGGIDSSALRMSAFHHVAINTGATKSPTIVTSFLDPESADRNGATAHVFALADDMGAGYQPTFKHTAAGSVSGAEFRRYIDHLDLNGDGVDEIVLEGWQFAGETFISVLGYTNGDWREIFRGRSSWCLSRPKKAD